MNKVKYACIFSGVGAPLQAMKRVVGDGFEHIFSCEIDKFARKSFKEIYDINEKNFHSDITKNKIH